VGQVLVVKRMSFRQLANGVNSIVFDTLVETPKLAQQNAAYITHGALRKMRNSILGGL
jgi:hypothetical protein